MNVRKATKADEAIVKSLWGYCFEKPSDPFFGWYFQNLCHMEEVLVGEENGQIACDLHRRPYTIQVRGKSFPVDYIVGVATHPAARGKGYARELLRGEFRLAEKEGKSLVILMPSAASFYLPMGFGFYVHQWERKASPERLSVISEKPVSCATLTDDSRWQELAYVYDQYTKYRNGYALRDEASWKTHIQGALLEGYVAVIYDNKKPIGYLCYTLEDRNLMVSEMAFVNEAGRKGIYAYMAGHQGSIDTCTWQEPLDDTSFRYWNDGAEHCYIQNRTFPYMLGRVTDPVSAFDGISCDTTCAGKIAFHLTDSFLPENSGLYILEAENGRIRVLREDSLKSHVGDVSGGPLGDCISKPAFSLSASCLAEWLLGAADISELLQLEKAQWLIQGKRERQEVQSLADAMLPKQKNWINEWY